MRQPGTYHARVSEYEGVDRAAGDAALSAYGGPLGPGGTEAVCVRGIGAVGGFAEE